MEAKGAKGAKGAKLTHTPLTQDLKDREEDLKDLEIYREAGRTRLLVAFPSIPEYNYPMYS